MHTPHNLSHSHPKSQTNSLLACAHTPARLCARSFCMLGLFIRLRSLWRQKKPWRLLQTHLSQPSCLRAHCWRHLKLQNCRYHRFQLAAPSNLSASFRCSHPRCFRRRRRHHLNQYHPPPNDWPTNSASAAVVAPVARAATPQRRSRQTLPPTLLQSTVRRRHASVRGQRAAGLAAVAEQRAVVEAARRYYCLTREKRRR
ncbi:hypothetical protein DFJ73DRAFT_840699 [Zopfochytrium polystomum]|nr:hypothetical protein DFJ73DRAFT_840699 [Zopfochytrium polystomum]